MATNLNPLICETAEAIRKVYEFSCVGGNLHIAIDDGNLDDGNLDFCAECIATNDVHEASPEQVAAETQCLDLLRKLTVEQREHALDLYHDLRRLEP